MKALFITPKDLKRKSIISGDTDNDKLLQFVEVAQDTHIQNYLGTNLYVKLQELVINDDINTPAYDDYKNLLIEYIKPMLIWYSQVAYLPFAPYNIGNGGLFKHRSSNDDTITQEELTKLIYKASETAEFYTSRFVDYMRYNSTLYPEYNTSSNEQMRPDRDVNFTGWAL